MNIIMFGVRKPYHMQQNLYGQGGLDTTKIIESYFHFEMSQNSEN